MSTASHVRTAGFIGMAGGVLWIISVILQYRLGLFESDGSPLQRIHQLIALAGMSCSGVPRPPRPQRIIMHILGWGLICIGGLALASAFPRCERAA